MMKFPTSRSRNEPIRILLRIDAGHQVGFGHAVRCSALLSGLTLDHEIVVAGDSSEALSRIFPNTRLVSVENLDLTTILDSERPDAVLVDLPCQSPDFWSTLRRSGRPIIAVDDEGGDVTADLVINGTLPGVASYPALYPHGKLLAGPQYSLLRSAFGETPWRNPADASITIVVGSGRRASEWAFALVGDMIDRSIWGRTTMVRGGANLRSEELLRACDRAGIHLLSALDEREMADLLAGSCVALITGGMVLFESLSVGTPVVVFPQEPNLIHEAAWLAARGIVRNLGFETGMDMTLVAAHVNKLLLDPVEAAAQSARGRAIVDGRGVERAAQAIETVLLNIYN